jgi:hypothetical protein
MLKIPAEKVHCVSKWLRGFGGKVDMYCSTSRTRLAVHQETGKSEIFTTVKY